MHHIPDLLVSIRPSFLAFVLAASCPGNSFSAFPHFWKNLPELTGVFQTQNTVTSVNTIIISVFRTSGVSKEKLQTVHRAQVSSSLPAWSGVKVFEEIRYTEEDREGKAWLRVCSTARWQPRRKGICLNYDGQWSAAQEQMSWESAPAEKSAADSW